MKEELERTKERYKICYMIRRFEEKVEEEFEKGIMRGTTHGCIGQEIIPVLVMEFLDKENDYVVGTHRCHGQVLAYTHDPYKLICEMTGKKDGFVQGLGGSQHIKVGNYITNGITGGMVTVGCGIALGLKQDGAGGMVVAYLGDGGFNEGYVQESFNLASCMDLPILFVCENNHYAMSTPTEKFSAGSFEARIKAFNIKFYGLSTNDIAGLAEGVGYGFEYVRTSHKPCFLEIETARLCGHSKSDNREYMTAEEKKEYESNDPLKTMIQELRYNFVQSTKDEIDAYLDVAFAKADQCVEASIKEGS